MAVWSLRPTTCPPSLSLSPSLLQSSSGFTATDFRHVSFSTFAYPTLSVKSSKHYNVRINIEDDDDPEEKINLFRKEVLKSGVLQEFRRRRFFETPRDKIKRKAREAAKRNRKRRPYPAQNRYEYDFPNKEKDDDGEEEDNWELLDVDVPYT